MQWIPKPVSHERMVPDSCHLVITVIVGVGVVRIIGRGQTRAVIHIDNDNIIPQRNTLLKKRFETFIKNTNPSIRFFSIDNQRHIDLDMGMVVYFILVNLVQDQLYPMGIGRSAIIGTNMEQYHIGSTLHHILIRMIGYLVGRPSRMPLIIGVKRRFDGITGSLGTDKINIQPGILEKIP